MNQNESDGQEGIAGTETESDETVTLSVKVPKWKRDAVKEQAHGRLSTATEHGLDLYLADDYYEETLRELREQAATLENSIEKQQIEIKQSEDELERVRAKIADIESERDLDESAYADHLDALESSLKDGGHIWAKDSDGPHSRVAEAAEVAGKTPEEVVDELKERNPEIPDDQFKPGTEVRSKCRSVDLKSVNRGDRR